MLTPVRVAVLCGLATAAAPVLSSSAAPVDPEAPHALPAVVVTAPGMHTPLVTRLNPRAPQQPLPANDGADLLKTIPGMSVVRKGGTDGDPLFRGMGGSRLNILLDGEQVLGGCGSRMDPPTAYIFPDAFDRVRLIKGPQSVVHGPGGSAATVLFERDPVYFSEPGQRYQAALTLASAQRRDAHAQAQAGTPLGFVQAQVSHAEAGDYRDGDGRAVHAAYERSSLSAAAGWTPDAHTSLVASLGRSRAEAAYADRGMDGSKFDRDHVGLKFDKRHMGGTLHAISLQAHDTRVDHVMDNHRLRPSSGTPMASNPDRRTSGARAALTWLLGEDSRLEAGLDHQRNVHRVRASGMGGDRVSPYDAQPRVADARFENLGWFGEFTHHLSEAQRIVAGLRQDHWVARDQRTSLKSGMMSLGVNPTAGLRRQERLHSGFARLERDWGSATTALVGLGYTERAPDYWELFSKEGVHSASAFAAVRPEKTLQLDAGLTHRQGPWDVFASTYYSEVNDHILIQSKFSKGMRLATVARNVDARTWGAEVGAHHQFHPQWTALFSLAHVRGENRSDGRALGQMPPLEARVGLNWQRAQWAVGALWRGVRAQARYALNEGNIVGQDLGRTPGFGLLSLHGAHSWGTLAKLSVGVDNVLDKTYAEAVSRGGAAVQGYESTTRINEPGRTWWLKLQVQLP